MTSVFDRALTGYCLSLLWTNSRSNHLETCCFASTFCVSCGCFCSVRFRRHDIEECRASAGLGMSRRVPGIVGETETGGNSPAPCFSASVRPTALYLPVHDTADDLQLDSHQRPWSPARQSISTRLTSPFSSTLLYKILNSVAISSFLCSATKLDVSMSDERRRR